MSGMKREPLLRLTGVTAFYDAIQALKGVDLEVAPGEIVTLIGANGAGKSTLMMTICGSPHARHGQIIYDGRDITALPTHKIMHMGMAQSPEGRRIFARMTVHENLLMGAQVVAMRNYAATRDLVFGLFPRLKERLTQRGGTLSGGEQQMLAMARAVMLNPEVVLLDEPSMGLAPILVAEVFKIIERLKREGVTMLLVEQFAAAALAVADYGYVLENGRISVHGPAEKLRDDPAVKAAYLGGGH